MTQIQIYFPKPVRRTVKTLTSLTKLNITGGPKDLSSKMDKYLYKKWQNQIQS